MYRIVTRRSNLPGAYTFTGSDTQKRRAISTCKRETLKLGLGGAGEVYTGDRGNELVMQCRVTLDNAGHPRITVED